MLVELNRFVEYNAAWNWPQAGVEGNRDGLTFEPMTINTEYVAWLRRYPIAGGVEFCTVRMVDSGEFILDITYEKMRDLLKVDSIIAKGGSAHLDEHGRFAQ